MWSEYILASTIDDVLLTLKEEGEKARVVAGATDLMLELERKVRKGVEILIDISRIPGLNNIYLDDHNVIHLGPLVTHNDCVSSKILQEFAYPLVRASWEVGSPQIRNRGTIAGNIITASPANDTISPLMALGARIRLRSIDGERLLPIDQFFSGVRKTVMRADEILTDIEFPALKVDEKGMFTKFALRKAQAISLVNTSIILSLNGKKINKAIITLGAVAPTIIHAKAAEEYLAGEELTEEVIGRAAELAKEASMPISDIRSSNAYRRKIVGIIVARGLRSIADGKTRDGFPETPVLLNSKEILSSGVKTLRFSGNLPIETTINGKRTIFNTGHEKSLLRLLREEGGLIGTKEGCGEGECGACTIHLDGKAVMACMVPAPRAHGAVITTIEGIAPSKDQLHPVQRAFIEHGAVQCGYCTPGFVMSSVKLLEEIAQPSPEQIKQAISGNLCRCTGYYKIVEAIEDAARNGG